MVWKIEAQRHGRGFTDHLDVGLGDGIGDLVVYCGWEAHGDSPESLRRMYGDCLDPAGQAQVKDFSTVSRLVRLSAPPNWPTFSVAPASAAVSRL